MWEFYQSGIKKGSCYGLSLHRKHAYNKKLRAGPAGRISSIMIALLIIALIPNNYFLGIANCLNDELNAGVSVSLGASPLYINEDHLDGKGESFVQEGAPIFRKNKTFEEELNSVDSGSDLDSVSSGSVSDSSDSDSETEDDPLSRHKPKFTRGGRVFRQSKGPAASGNMPQTHQTKFTRGQVFFNRGGNAGFGSDRESSGETMGFGRNGQGWVREMHPQAPAFELTEAGKDLLKNYKDLKYPKEPFHPHQGHTFKNVVIERQDDVLDLRQRNGVLTAKFKLETIDDNALMLLDHLAKNTASCTVRWASLSKKTNTGQMHLDCKFDVKADGYAGDTPIDVKIHGFSGKVMQTVKLNSNGMSFTEQFDSSFALKREVMKALGLDPVHECRFMKINKKHFRDDEQAFKYLTLLVENGSKNVEVVVQPFVRVFIHIRHPFSGITDSFTYDGGYMKIIQFKDMLDSKKKTEDFCSRVTKDDSTKYTLIGFNDKFVDLENYTFDKLREFPLDMIITMIYIPYVTVNFHYLDKTVLSKPCPVSLRLMQVINFGKQAVKKFNKNLNIKNPDYRVYSYSIQGCLEEHRDLGLLAAENGIRVMPMIPFSDTCVNRETNVLNLYYLNQKPSQFNFEADVYGPDGTNIVSYKVSVDYNPRAKLSYIKEEVLNRLLKDGHVLSADELFFVNLTNYNGERARDDMLVKEVVDVMQEQKKAVLPRFEIAVNPRFDVVYRDRKGGMEKFKVDMNKTNPTRRDLTDAVDGMLHERHMLGPEEHIHTVRVHPRNKKNKINFGVDIRSDDTGHFPPGTRADQMTVETDLRMEIPVEFHYDNGRVIKFKVNADYGATEEEIERLVRKELHKRGLKGNIPGLYFEIKNSQHNDFKEFWGGGPDVEKFVLNTELAGDMEVDGDIHGVPFTAHVKVHPRETMDQLQSDVLYRVKQNPKIKVWLDEDPSREREVTTVVSDLSGRVYDDDELGNNFLYNKSSKLRVGVSDHPFEMVWKHPLTGQEISFCLTKTPDGRCRPLPPRMLRFPIQDFVDHLLKLIKKAGKYDEYVVKPVKTGKLYSPTVRLKEVRTVDGHRFNCNEIPLDGNFRLIEYAFNVQPSQVRAMVFSLMTVDERENLAERERAHRRYKVVVNKQSGDHESHLLDTDDLNPTEVRNLIYKNFSSVANEDDIDDLKFYDDSDHEVDYTEYVKHPRVHDTLKVKFSMKNDGPRPKMPQFADVNIQPKPHETIRQFFTRAVEEPLDFGLSPMHSYTVVGEDDAGNFVRFDDLLDVPVKDIKNVTKIRFVKKAAVRPDANPNIYYSERPPTETPNVVTLEFDNKRENFPTLNTKIRDFLIRVPPEQMGHVKVEVDGTQLRCSLEALRDAYMIKNLTVERLFDLCQGYDREKGFTHVKMNFNMTPEDLKKSETYNLLEGLGSPSGAPIANFTLYKGQNDLGLSTLVKVNVASLNSPLTEFYSKIVQMFGDSLNFINEVFISLIKNGRMYPCNNAKVLKTLKDFSKTPLVKIFQICGLPAVIPENGTYHHFHVSVNFNVSTTPAKASAMGKSVPVDIYYDEDDRMTNVHMDENLYPEISRYVDDNNDIDKSHLNKYRVTIKAEQPTHEFVTKTYDMNELPHNLTMHDMFPDITVDGLNITIDSKDGKNVGGWKSETVHPVNDFKAKFDALKRQIILNLKTMHGDNLDNLNSFSANVRINGVKHKCQIENVSKLVTMSLDQFLKDCVNINDVNNNPSMSFGVAYDPKVGVEKTFNVKVMMGDKTLMSAEGLGPNDKLPRDMVEKIKEKYKDGVNGVQWGAYINRDLGDCHFTGILDIVDMNSVLGLCGVTDRTTKVFNLVFFDMNYESYRLLNSEEAWSETESTKGKSLPDLFKVTQTVKTMKSPVRVSMPFSYEGPEIEIKAEDTLNDSVRKIVTSEDEFNTGNPFKVKVHTNHGDFGVEQLPKVVSNHPSRDLNGTVSFIVEDDPSGSDPGTLLNLHFPDTSQTLGDFVKDLENNPSNANKKFYFTSKDTFLPTTNVPLEFLNLPINHLKERGYFITVVNETVSPDKGNSFFVNILSRDGVSASDRIGDLQQPLTSLFAKITKDQASLDKMLNGKFQMLVDGFPTKCNFDNLQTFQNGMTLDNLLAMCGVTDMDRNHVITLFFETPIAGKGESHELKLKVDLNDTPKEEKNVDYGTKFTLGSDVEEFLKSKKDAHVYVDVKGKDNVNDFVEVDSLKFLQLLGSHPEVVNMLLKLGVPQTHLGSLDALHLVISNLTNALKGHQSFNIESGENKPYEVGKPISEYKDILVLKEKVALNPDLRMKGTVTLADGSKDEFDIRGREFVHAVDGGLTFRELALRALSSNDADKVIHVNLATYETDEESAKSLGSKRRIFRKTRSSPPSVRRGPTFGGLQPWQRTQSEALRRSSESTLSESEASSEGVPVKQVPKIQTIGGVFSSPPRQEVIKPHRRGSVAESEASHSSKSSTSSQGSVSSVSGESVVMEDFFQGMLDDPEKKVSMEVKTSSGRVYHLMVKVNTVKKAIQNGNKMKKLLQNYLLNEDVEDVVEVEISEKLGLVFTVPLKKHVQINLPVVASDKPTDCDIQDFKNPWNPQENVWKNFTVKSAMEAYAKELNVTDKPKAVYLLKKEDHNNLSAEIIFDEDHPQDDAKLNRKIGEELSRGKTLFIRYKDTGELAE